MKKIVFSYISISLSLLIGVYSELASASYAYVANSNDNSITLCTDAGVEGLDECGDSGAGMIFDAPTGIAIPDTTFSGNTYAYITNRDAGTISQCQVNIVDGSLSDDCNNTDDIFSFPIGVAFQSIEGTLYAYVTNATIGDITTCTVNATTGALENCENGTMPFGAPIGMAIQTMGTTDYAYISNSHAGTITRCYLNSMTGVLSECLDSGVGAAFSAPQNIRFFTTDDLYAYITDSTYSTSGTVWQCNVDDTSGMLSACAETGSDFNQPMGIDFKTIGSVDYAYITNVADNTYTYCEVTSSGELICSTSSSIPQNRLDPMGLAYFTVNDVDYIYVANPDVGTVSQCRINDSAGNLYCVDSGVHAQFNIPYSINLYTVASSIFAQVVDTEMNVVWVCSVNTTSGQFMECSEQGEDIFVAPVSIAVGIDSHINVYVSDTDGIIWRCRASVSDGSFSDCESAGDYPTYGFNNPRGLSVQDFGIYRYVYIVNYQPSSSSAAQIVQCATDSSTGLFTSCVDSGAGYALAYPNAISFQGGFSGLGVIAFLPETGSFGGDSYVHKFSVSSTTGQFTALSADNTTIDGKSGIAFAVAGFTQYVYLTNDDDSSISKCPMDIYGEIEYTSCVTSIIELSTPVSIDIQTVMYYTGAYIVYSDGSIQGCRIEPAGGSFAECQDMGTGLIFNTPSDITLQIVDENNYAYITDGALGTVTRCLQDPVTGFLTACTPSGVGAIFGTPTSIAFDTLDDTIYAYIVNTADNITYQCELDSSGLFVTDSCADIATVFDAPLGLSINNNFAYIADAGNNRIIMCELGGEGALGSCADSGAGDIFLEPADITFFTDASENLNAYITNAESNCSFTNVKKDTCDTTAVNSVTYCSVDAETGLFSDCNDSSLGSVFKQPTGIALGSSYAYVSNSDLGYNRISRCSLNSDGSFDACGDSGAGTSYFAQPFGITFFTP